MESVENGKEALIIGIEKDARSEAESIIAEAETLGRERRKNIEQQVLSVHKDAEKKAVEQAEVIRKKILSGVDVEVKRRKMRIQDETMKDMMNQVKENLYALINKPEYRDILLAWVVEAAVGLGAESVEVNASKDERIYFDKKFIQEAEKRIQDLLGYFVKLTMSEGHPLRSQGIVLTAEDGRTAYDNRIHTRILRKQREIRKYIYDNLFTEEH